MAKIVLISCISKKLNHKSKAKDLYVSPLFRKSLQCAKSLNPDKIFILFAECGLLDLNRKIEPYDKNLNKMSSDEIKEWLNSVLNQLQKVSYLGKDDFVFFTENNCRKFLLPHIKNYGISMFGLRIEKQLKLLVRACFIAE